MAYATAAQMCQKFDRREISQMCAESDTNIPPAASIEGNAILLSALESASGQVRSAALIANKYTEADLETLAGNQDDFLVTLICRLAMGSLLIRRSVHREVPPVIQDAMNWLAALRLGEMIFNVQANRDKGNVHTVQPTTVELSNEGMLSGRAAGRWFPQRAT